VDWFGFVEGERKWSWWAESRDSRAYQSGEWNIKGERLVLVAVNSREKCIE